MPQPARTAAPTRFFDDGRVRLVLAATIFSTGGAVIKATTLTAWQVAGFRSGIAALTLLALLPAARRGWTWRTTIVGIAYACTLVLFVTANKLTTSANTIFLQSTSPLYILLLSPLLLREAVRPRDIGFMLAVGAGLAMFFVHQDAPLVTAPDPVRGNILAAASGFTWALTVMGLRWLGSDERRGSSFAAMVSGNGLVFVACLPLALPVVSATALDWGAVVFLGTVQIGLAYMLLATGIRTVTALEASLLLLVEPALNPIWSWMVHGESPSVWALAGAVVIFGATTLRTWFESRVAVAP